MKGVTVGRCTHLLVQRWSRVGLGSRPLRALIHLPVPTCSGHEAEVQGGAARKAGPACPSVQDGRRDARLFPTPGKADCCRENFDVGTAGHCAPRHLGWGFMVA